MGLVHQAIADDSRLATEGVGHARPKVCQVIGTNQDLTIELLVQAAGDGLSIYVARVAAIVMQVKEHAATHPLGEVHLQAQVLHSVGIQGTAEGGL